MQVESVGGHNNGRDVLVFFEKFKLEHSNTNA